jgi:hypothetical protein
MSTLSVLFPAHTTSGIACKQNDSRLRPRSCLTRASTGTGSTPLSQRGARWYAEARPSSCRIAVRSFGDPAHRRSIGATNSVKRLLGDRNARPLSYRVKTTYPPAPSDRIWSERTV